MSVQTVDALSFIRRIGPIWVAVVVMYVVFGIVQPGMFKASHVMNILQVAAFLGTVTLGQTMALLAGCFDLSVSGVVSLTNITLCIFMNGQPERTAEAVLISLALALGVGLINGALVAVVRITPLIVTLAMNSILFGGALVFTGGAIRGRVTEEFAQLGQGYVLGFPVSAVCWLALAVLMAWLTRKTVFGRHLYAVGANPRAAYVMGVRVNRMVIAAYLLSAAMAWSCGVLLTAYINNPSLGIGAQFQLTSVAAAVVGGTALTGGVGGIVGAVGGALFITELNSFLNMIKVSSGVQFLLQGVVIAASVVIYRVIGGSAIRH
jgi:ribose transport system permease protein